MSYPRAGRARGGAESAGSRAGSRVLRPGTAPRIAGALAALALVAIGAQRTAAQSLPTATQQVQDVERRIDQPPGALPAAPDAPAAAAAPAGADQLFFELAGVALIDETGAPLSPASGLPVEDLRAIYAGDVGARVSAADMLALVQAMRVTLREAGFVFTRVAIPDARAQLTAPSPLSLRIEVIGALVETLEIQTPEGEIGPVMAAVEKIAAPLRGKLNPTLEDLERVSLLISDIPGLNRATFVPTAGSAPGRIRLDLNVVRDPWQGVFIADNRQSPIVGPALIGGIAAWNSHTALGGTTELAYFNSLGDDHSPFDLDERNTIQLRHFMFFGEGATRLELRALYSQSKPGDGLRKVVDLTNTQTNAAVEVEHPFLRTRKWSFWGGGGFEYDLSDSETGAGTITDDTLSMPYLRLRGVERDAAGFTRGFAELRLGVDLFGASKRGDAGLSRLDGGGDFLLLRGEIEREQDLGAGFGLIARAKAQWSSEPLLSTQEFTVGGGLYGKAFDPSELTGDSGFAVYGEVNYSDVFTLQDQDLGWQVYGFVDYGLALNIDNALPGRQDMTSTGVGLRLNIARDTDLEFEAARSLDRALARNGERDLRFFFGLTQRF